jgi:hypothetical protein
MTNVIVVLAILALVLGTGWLIMRDANTAFNNTWGDADMRCFYCGDDPKWCACRDELPYN